MKELSKILLEKLKINKNTNIGIEEQIIDILLNKRKVLWIDKVLEDKIYKNNIFVNQIWVETNKKDEIEINYSSGEFGKSAKIAEKLSDLFSKEQLEKIYNYLINNEDFN